jgi:hypothetical protein
MPMADKTINVEVRDKIATASPSVCYICDNSDFVVNFDFDDEWGSYEYKTARFIYNEKYIDVVFMGNQCEIPVISNTNTVQIGVFAGDLCTTTAAWIPAKKSILNGDGVPDDPPEGVYNQIMVELGNISKEIDTKVDERINSLEQADEDLARRAAALEQRFEDMDYGNGIVINSFIHSETPTRERGEKITYLVLAWRFDRNPVTQTLTGPTLDGAGVSPAISGKDYSYPIRGVTITADNQGSFRWKIAATDNRGKAVSQTSPGFTFLNCVYYGAAEEPETIDSLFIRSLGTKTSPTDKKARRINVNGGGKYIWYCLPTELGTCTFKSNGFPAGIELVDTIAFTNALGYTENYYVYRSNQKITDTVTIEVS